MSYNLLFVCTGNTCRSPMAAALASHAAEGRGWSGLDVASAGVAALPGSPASPEVPVVLEELGIDAPDHLARELTPDLVEWADAVFVMAPQHGAAVAAMGGENKVALITEYVPGAEAGAPVRDPIGGSVEVYRETRDQLRRAIDAILDQIQPIVAP